VGRGRNCQNARVSRRTIVAFHAHPDDEALLTAGTLARAAAEGHRTVLVLATRGERGDVGADLLGDGEELGGRRSAEAEASAQALGVARLEFLELLDSGHAPGADGAWPPGSLCAADPREVADRLAALLAEEDADVLLADDANGGYGHPDHRRVHEIACLAAWYTPAERITHAVDVTGSLDAKRASMRAHASQATGAPDTVRTLAVFLDLPAEVFALAFGTEWFRRPGAPTEPRATDLLAGLPAAAP
jgi:LmbE family N-acetylglucosaminyl deacetylase